MSTSSPFRIIWAAGKHTVKVMVVYTTALDAFATKHGDVSGVSVLNRYWQGGKS